MPATGYLFQLASGVPLVTVPAELDTAAAGGLRAILVEWQSRGHTTVVVDLTGTRFCDWTGLRELMWAHQRAVADGGGLRLVMPADGALQRVFTGTGLEGIPRFATVTQALPQASADRRSCAYCGAVFVPQYERAGSAAASAGPPGTASIWVIRSWRRARSPGRWLR